MQASRATASVTTCLNVAGDPIATREFKRTFLALGFKSCAGRTYRREEVAGATTKHSQPASLAMLLRDEAAAARATPALRKAMLASFSSTGTASGFAPHSLPVAGLGDEAPRGVTFSGSLGPLLGKATFFSSTSGGAGTSLR